MTEASMPLGVTAVMLPELDFAAQVDLCQSLRLTHYCLRPRIIPDARRSEPYSNWGNHQFDLTPERLVREGREIRKRLSDAGLTPFGTLPVATVADSDETIRLHLEGAAAVGAGRVRVGPLDYPAGPFDYAQFLARSVERYQQIVALAKPFGQKIVIETHAGSLAASPGLAWSICRHFDPADLGVIFDLPNFAREGNLQPNLAVAVLRPYIDHCHIGGSRRTEGARDAAGFRRPEDQFCAMADTDLHLPTWLTALRSAGVAAPLIIEDFRPGIPGAQRLTESAAQLRRVLQTL